MSLTRSTSSVPLEVDVLVVGAGPAGCSFALNLAPWRRVVLIDRQVDPGIRVGESLPPAARRLLSDMGLWTSFLEQGHLACHAAQSCWGSETVEELDHLRDPDGAGWHLDRPRFDAALRAAAQARGAALLTPAELRSIDREGTGWRAEIEVSGRRVPLQANFVVDAGGRSSSLARRLGAQRRYSDRLVCGWVLGRDTAARQAGLTQIEAEPEGWWYSAPLPDGQRMLAFYTDADLPAATEAAHPERLLQRVQKVRRLAAVLKSTGFEPGIAAHYCAARSSALDRACGEGWLAVGDAALGFDPLSSQGLLNALYTGLAAAEAAHRVLDGHAAARVDYADAIAAIHNAYRQHLQAWYGLEQRWAHRPFWQRRQTADETWGVKVHEV